MPEQINPGQVEEQENLSSGLLLSVEQLQGGTPSRLATDGGKDTSGSGDKDTSDTLTDTDGSDAVDTDGTDKGEGGDSDGSDLLGSDVDGTDDLGGDSDGTDITADSDSSDK